ncbi:hypothetical protein G6F42_011024 [Rhizopus arrhizus]|nr:hypothetical protein G6F42_011024 [Rhizopus arrhizus]
MNGSITVRNVFGGAELLETVASFGTRNSSAFQDVKKKFSLSKPVNASPDSRLDINAHRVLCNNTLASSYEELARGAGLRYKTVSKFGYHELSYDMTWRSIDRVSPNASLSIRQQVGDSLKSSINHVFVRERRDDILLPSNGHYVRIAQELSGLFGVGNAHFFKTELESQYCTQIGGGHIILDKESKEFLGVHPGLVISTTFRAGCLADLSEGDKASTVSDRFLLGGPLSVRGFRNAGIGPRDYKDALGGNLYWAAGVSAIAPLPKLETKALRAHAFVNAGTNVPWKSGTSLQDTKQALTQSPSISAGLGLIYRHSIARIELNYCVPLTAARGDQIKRGLQLGIGLNFLTQTLVESERVASAALLRPLPRRWHMYVWPFVSMLYPVFTYVYYNHYDTYLGSEEWTFVALGSIITLHAMTFLVCQWSVDVKALFTCVKENDVKKAAMIKIVPFRYQGKGTLVPLEHSKKFIWNFDKKQFQKLLYPSDLNHTVGSYQSTKGLTTQKEIESLTHAYGLNKFEIPLPTFMELFKEHAVAPFFVFQIFCVGLWCLDEYWYYSLFTLFMLVVFECTVVYQRLRTIGEFRGMNQKPYPVYVKREKKWVQIQSDDLLPGDVVSIVRTKEDQGVPCDLVIADGSCIVNEAMLSGESTPLLKESIALRDPNEEFDMNVTDRLNVLYGGTKVLQVTTPENEAPPDEGCVCVVARTGFGTSQGELVRTMIFSTERVSANNFEALLFILFLLIFAIAASWYVWQEGVKNDRKKSKLLLDCILIITSVVPPELPMELSLAVNSSLVALSKYAIYCTEPFRIPYAGRVDVCCFDKTGTLTGEDLVFEGVAYADDTKLMKATEVPDTTKWVLSSAHALVQLEDGIVGDPMEKETLKALDWELGPHDIVFPKGEKGGHSLQIRRRYQFSSALKRQSSVSNLSHTSLKSTKTFIAVKGAPETLKLMYTKVPDNYVEAYRHFTRKGSRVLALGYKMLDNTLTNNQINDLAREAVESDLIFAGFIVFTCPLKDDAIEALKELNESSHRCIMITGDNPLTACAVAREVAIVEREVLIVDRDEARKDNKVVFQSIDETYRLEVNPAEPLDAALLDKYDLCLTGSAMSQFMLHKENMNIILEHTWVYARVSPSQKEYLLTGLKDLGYTTLMAGDGTNDVGALKQAHIGVALLDGTPEDLQKIAERQRIERMKAMYEQQKSISARFNQPPPPPPPAIAHLYPEFAAQLANQQNQNLTPAQRRQMEQKKKIEEATQKMMEGMDMEEPPTIKFGDASVAAPFTSKLRNVTSINNIIRQGRCTLVATIQMYKILALNCLISAYSLSVLYLDGIKFGDLQVTISGMLMAVCFLCISRGKPLQKLSKERPQPNIFNPYIILSVLGQFAIHIVSLVYINALAKSLEPPKEVDLEGEFEPSLLNSAVYLIQLSMQVSTFAINYQGYPFRERIQDNKALYYGLMSVGGVALAGATEMWPEVNDQLKLVQFPGTFRYKLTLCMILDFGIAYAIEKVTKFMFADNRAKAIARRNND